MSELDQYLQDSNLVVVRSDQRLRLVQLKNMKLVEIQIIDDSHYSIQEITNSVRGEGRWDISLENVIHQIDYLES